MDSTVNFNGVYGPAAGQGPSSNGPIAAAATKGLGPLPVGLVSLVLLGVLAWWVLEAWD